MKISKIPFSYNFTLSLLSLLTRKAKLSVTQHLLPPQEEQHEDKKKKNNTMASAELSYTPIVVLGQSSELRV